MCLMDFNPFGVTTDSLLYSWDELESDENLESADGKLSSKLELRIIEDNYGISTSQYSMYGQPKESLQDFLNSKKEDSEGDKLSALIDKV